MIVENICQYSVGTNPEAVAMLQNNSPCMLSGPGDFFMLHSAMRLLIPFTVMSMCGIDRYGEIPISGFCVHLEHQVVASYVIRLSCKHSQEISIYG